MSSWLRRVAVAYGTKLGALLNQLTSTECDPTTFDWSARPDDIAEVAVALGTTKSDLVQRSFIHTPGAGLMFILPGTAAKTCAPCKAEFISRGLPNVVLRRWKIAVVRTCGRCGGRLAMPSRASCSVVHDVECSANLREVIEDVFHAVSMAMYDPTEAPVVARVFRAVSSPIRWPRFRAGGSAAVSIVNGPAIMWRAWNQERAGVARAVPKRLDGLRFATWSEGVQIIAAASVRQLALGPASEWSDLRKLGLIETGDTTIARRLFRA